MFGRGAQSAHMLFDDLSAVDRHLQLGHAGNMVWVLVPVSLSATRKVIRIHISYTILQSNHCIFWTHYLHM
jgi:hypothetical protein